MTQRDSAVDAIKQHSGEEVKVEKRCCFFCGRLFYLQIADVNIDKRKFLTAGHLRSFLEFLARRYGKTNLVALARILCSAPTDIKTTSVHANRFVGGVRSGIVCKACVGKQKTNFASLPS